MAQDKQLRYLVEHLVKTINLPDFVESVTDSTLIYGKCHCPMPNHNDRNASFHVNKMGNGAWIFHCFGCHVKGHIVHFVKDYYGLRSWDEAILFLCKKFDIKDKEDLIIQGLKNVSKKVDSQRKMENANIMVSNQCRMLLRKDFKLHKDWVSDAYKRINTALDDENYETIESIGYEASNRMSGAIEAPAMVIGGV